LKKFGFKQFTNEFIEKLKREIIRLKVLADQEFDWDNVKGAAAYNDALQAKVARQRERQENDPSFDSREERYKTWEDDPGEEARWIWIWWADVRDKFTSFSTALRLVALVQTSSASVERLFSVLKLVVDAIGNNMLEETLETRLFVKYNMVRNGFYLSQAAHA
jgi:hypothetical protein